MTRFQRIVILFAGPGLLLALLALPLFGSDFELQLGTLIVVYSLAVVGLDVLAGRAGLLHNGFGIMFGAGAYAVVVLAQHWPSVTLVAVIAAALLSAVLSVALGLLLARSSIFIFAVLTLAAATAAASVVNNLELLGGTSGLAAPTRNLVGAGDVGPIGLYLLTCAIFAAVAALYLMFRFSATGRAIEASRLVPNVAQASGVNIATLRVKLSLLSGFLGGLAGGLYAVQQQYVSADLLGAISSVNFLAMNIVGGTTVALAGLPGAFITVGLPQLFQGLVAYQIILLGVVTGVVALWFRRGVAGTLQDLWWRAVEPLFAKQQREPVASAATAAEPAFAAAPRDTTTLELRGAGVQFGGLVALNNVSLDLKAGRVHALIGPNGAGKSTLVSYVAGSAGGRLSGSLHLDGRDVATLRPEQRATLGITRTFQLVSLCETMTALENVMLGAHVSLKSSFVLDFLSLRRRGAQRSFEERARMLLRRLGAEEITRARPREMTSGQQRLVEIARCLMANAQVIMLDEPAAGLSSAEREKLADVVRSLADDGHTVLLIEHDLEFVMWVAERITVLVNGAVLADGDPELVRADPRVIEAYWGRPVTS